MIVTLAAPADVEGFRHAARTALRQGVPPSELQWVVADAIESGLFDAADTPLAADGAAAAGAPAFTVPRRYGALVAWAALHADGDRHALLYSLLWRLQTESGLRSDPLDPQWLHAERLAHDVRRDLHKMKAFVRFRPIDRGPAEPPLHVAWFEPEHHVVEAVAPFFVQRFAQLHWSILTPRRSLYWDGARLHLGGPARRDAAPSADAGEALWLTYYAHIFNPARLKVAMMRKEMPRRYWPNLPEAELIDGLTSLAHERTAAMIDRPADAPNDRIPVHVPAAEPPVAVAPPDLASLASDADVSTRDRAWTATRQAAAGCTQCPLYADATQTVFGIGPVDARLMFVGEQPGDQEDLRGAPFVGPAGQLLARALSELAIEREAVYITNAVKHFKFELRGQRRIHKTPAQQEVAACVDWLEREIALVRPRGIVALGATAARALLGRAVPVLKERGHWFARDDAHRVLVTLHPSALLRMPPDDKEAAYRAWLADLRAAVDGIGGHAATPTGTAPAASQP